VCPAIAVSFFLQIAKKCSGDGQKNLQHVEIYPQTSAPASERPEDQLRPKGWYDGHNL
jgi:hypothetical protein